MNIHKNVVIWFVINDQCPKSGDFDVTIISGRSDLELQILNHQLAYHKHITLMILKITSYWLSHYQIFVPISVLDHRIRKSLDFNRSFR